jgi:cytochrome c oxidase subunit II
MPSGNTPVGRIRSSSIVAAALGFVISLAALSGYASAHAAGSASPEEWDSLLLLLIVLGAIVATLVYSAIVLALWRFRESSDYVRKEPQTHNFKLEAVWTTIPLIIVTVIVILSIQVLETTEELPEEGITIEVIARQFEWEFVYPDNTSTKNELWIEEGQTVIFKIQSEDVIHSFFLPDFRLKVDAFPNYVDDAYIIAEPAGEYNIFCAEYCGDVHSSMLATLHIYHRGLNDKPLVDIEMADVIGNGSQPPWSTTPSLIDLPYGAEVTLRVWNNASQGHPFHLGAPYDRTLDAIPPGEFRYVNFTADKPTAGVPAYCQEEGHREGGLSTTIVVEPDTGEGTVVEDIAFPYAPALYGLGLVILGLTMGVALRTPKEDVHEEHTIVDQDDGHDYHVPGEEEEKTEEAKEGGEAT